jgi:antitoxin YefM
MPYTASLSEARENLAKLLDKAIDDREIITITRKGHEPVAIIAMSELSSLMETLHLLRSPRNRDRLLEAMESAERGEGERISVEQLRKEFGLGKEAGRQG